MNRKHYLLELFNGVADHLIAQAAESREEVPPARRKIPILLVAALVVLGALLVGCVAVFLGLQERKIGEIPVTQSFDAYGNPVAQPEKTWYLASMSGFEGSPAQQACQEWNAFQRSYQPENLTNQTDDPDIPNRYEYTYSCFDQTMVEKLTEIAEKYGLELLGTRAVAQAWQREAAFEILGLTHLVAQDIPGEAAYGACLVCPPYNFVCDVRLTLTGPDAPWTEEAYCQVSYLQSGYLAPDDVLFYDPENTQQWEYTARDGTRLLLALSDTDGIVIAQRQDCTIVIQMDLAWQQGAFLDPDTPLPTRKALEALADCFDYTITTQAAPMEGLQKQFDAIPDPQEMDPPEDFQSPLYTSFAGYLEENYLWPELVEYAFYDIDGDGQQDLLTSYGDGFCLNWLSLRDGQVVDLMGGRGPLRLCENGVAESRDVAMESHIYMKILGPDPEVGVKMEPLCGVGFGSGQWKIDGDVCTAQEAADRMAQYKPQALSWKPLTEFPMDPQGTTFADLTAQEGTLAGEALFRFYAEHYRTDWGWDYSWFELRDINDDGIEDLLLSHDGEYVDAAYTCKRGRFVSLDAGFYLCEDNSMHSSDQVDRYNVGILERHHFHKLIGQHYGFYYQLTHNLSTGTWEDTNYTEISEEEARKILEKYTHVEMNMRPIQELIGS